SRHPLRQLARRLRVPPSRDRLPGRGEAGGPRGPLDRGAQGDRPGRGRREERRGGGGPAETWRGRAEAGHACGRRAPLLLWRLAARGGGWFRGDGIELHLGVEQDSSPARKAHPALVVDGLDHVEQRLVEQGVEISRDAELEGHRRFYVDDPFGNRLEFIERD